jgi:hypothetical protein
MLAKKFHRYTGNRPQYGPPISAREIGPVFISSRLNIGFERKSIMNKALTAIAGLALAVSTHSAAAAIVSGHGALALGALVGSYSTTLTGHDKAVLARLFDGKAAGKPAKTILVKSDAVVCHAGDVDISAFGCALTFGAKTLQLTGRRANELFATIGEAGVPPEGAAGKIYAGLHAMSCVVDPAAIAQKGGGGATCSFDPGPP